MPMFQYKAKQRNADTVLGQIIAVNREDAVEKIHMLDLVPVSVTEVFSSGKKGVARPSKVGTKTLYQFSRQMFNLIKAGVPILRTLEIISGQVSHKYFRDVVQDIRLGVQQGRSFSDCLAEYPRVFSTLYITMVKAGEESGNLKETIFEMAEYLKRQDEIASKVKTAIAYPILMILFGMGTVFFILTYVMPQITSLFKDLNQDLPWPTVLVMNVSAFLNSGTNFFILLIALLLAILGIKSFLKTKKGQTVLALTILETPFFKDFWLQVEVARFCRTLELLLKSGVTIVKAIRLSLPVVQNELLKQEFLNCQEALVAGRSLGASLKQSKWVPAMVGQVISVGEESGSLATTLHDIAENYEQETNDAIKVMTTLLEPLMIILVGSVIGFIIIAMLLPIFQMDMFSR